MTNKQERFYVVSESDLVAVREAAYSEGMADADVKHVSDYFATRIEAEAACRMRSVPEWATHFCKLDYYKVGDQIQEAEEIKK